jgi:hypothetical protein
MESKERKILQLRFGYALLKILAERKDKSEIDKRNGIKDHKLVSSLRKLAAASGTDYGTIQKISKGDQGFEFFTFFDIIDALDLDLIQFSKYFYSVTDEDVKRYQALIQRSRKEVADNKKKNKKNK